MRRAVVALGILLVAVPAASGVAAAQTPPTSASGAGGPAQPGGQPSQQGQPGPPNQQPAQGPQGQPPQQGQGQAPVGPTTTVNDPPNVKADARLAAGALARKVSIMMLLGGFGTPPNARLTTLLEPSTIIPTTDRAELLRQLELAMPDADAALRKLLADGVDPQQDVVTLLSPLSPNDKEALKNGGTVAIDSEFVARSFDSLINRNGRRPNGQTPPDPVQIRDAVPGIVADAPPLGQLASTLPSGGGGANPSRSVPAGVTSTGGAPAPDSTGPNALLIAAFAIALLAIGGAIALLISQRRSRRPAHIDDLLEVSRRLTNATATGEIDRAIVREGIGLANASAGALVRRRDGRLVVGFESQPDMLVPEHLMDGIFARVAETGQSVTQISATEPAIRSLPVSLAAVPLVGGGAVAAVLVVIRRDAEPFTVFDRDVLASLAPVAAAALHSASQAEAAMEQSMLDPLTGAGNRRRLDTELPALLAETGDRPTGFIMIDLDRFKSVNDTHGHPAGDAVLRGVASLLRETVRPGDRVYRYGGEEFCVVLPDTEEDAARDVAERVRETIGRRAFDAGLAQPLHATASFGVAVTYDGDMASLLGRADAALYDAKEAGRDRVSVARRVTPDPAS